MEKKEFDFSIIQEALDKNDPVGNPPIDNEIIKNEPIDNDNPPIEDPNPPIDNDSPFTHFAKVLQEEGFFSEEDLEGFDGSIDSLVQRTVKIADRLAEQKTTNYTPEAKKYMELLNKGISEDDAKEIVAKQIELNKIDEAAIETDVDVQKFVMRKYLEKTGLSTEEIDEQIEYFDDQGRLFQKSHAAYGKLKNDILREEQLAKEKAEQAIKDREEENKRTLDTVKKRVFDMDEFIPGMKLNETMKEKIYKKLTTPAKIENGVPVSHVGLKRMKDPVQFEITLNLLDELGVFDGKFDALLNAGKKKSVNELEQAIQTSDFFNKQSPQTTQGNIAKEIVESIKGLPDFRV